MPSPVAAPRREPNEDGEGDSQGVIVGSKGKVVLDQRGLFGLPLIQINLRLAEGPPPCTVCVP